MHGSSPNQPRGRNQWNDPSPQRGQDASQGNDWDRDIDDVSGGSGREYGHSNSNDRGYGQGAQSQQAGGGSDPRAQGGSDMPGAGMQGSGRNQAYSQHGEDRYGEDRLGGRQSFDRYGGESQGSGGRAHLQDRSGVGGFGDYGSTSNRSSGYGSVGSQHGGQQQGQSHRGRGPRQYTRSDERILEDVCERLTDDHDIDASDIEVKAQSGSVTLEGSVTERWMKHRAEDLVDACSGVKQVDNRLRVKSSASGSNDGRSQDIGAGTPSGGSSSSGPSSSGSSSTGPSSQQPH
ncbi:BON domain-containing protein [Lysobacter sp. A3-1-A15]